MVPSDAGHDKAVADDEATEGVTDDEATEGVTEDEATKDVELVREFEFVILEATVEVPAEAIAELELFAVGPVQLPAGNLLGTTAPQIAELYSGLLPMLS